MSARMGAVRIAYLVIEQIKIHMQEMYAHAVLR